MQNRQQPCLQKKGFTLLELMVALFIFAIVAILAIRGLQNVLLAEHTIDAHADSLAKTQLHMIILQNDFNQIMVRPIIDQNGVQQPALIGTTNSIEFTHGGYINPLAVATRSTMQRVSYLLEKDRLVRTSWAQLDRTPQTPLQKNTLFNKVTDLKFQYLNNKGKFYDHWPLQPNAPISSSNPSLPNAIEITVTFAQQGQIDHVFIVSATDPVPTTNAT